MDFIVFFFHEQPREESDERICLSDGEKCNEYSIEVRHT